MTKPLHEPPAADDQPSDETKLLDQIRVGSPDAIYIKDAQRRYIFINEAMCRILQVGDPASIIGKTSDTVVPPDRIQPLQGEDNKILATGEPVVGRIERNELPNGTVQWLSTNKAALRNQDGDVIGIIGVTRDITARVKIDEERLIVQNRLDRILILAPDAIIAADSDQRIVLFNKSAEKIFGYTAAEAVGQPLDIVLPLHDAEAHHRFVDEFGRAPQQTKDMTKRDPIRGRRKNGEEFPAEASIGKYMENGKPFFTAIVRDITERRRAEEQLIKRDQEIAALNERLTRDNANLTAVNAELEAFSYSVSHDLRAPLRAIDGFSQLLQEEFNPLLGERGRDHTGRIRRAAQRMGMVIDDLLTLSRISRGELSYREVDLSAQAKEILAGLQAGDPDRKVDVNIAVEVKTRGDARLLRIALENLLSNAWKFSSQRSPALIELGQSNVNGEVVYFVRDNGVGFDMANASKLFMAFQRFHDEKIFPGDGIGLAIVKRIINRHGGRIWAVSDAGKGATFYFVL